MKFLIFKENIQTRKCTIVKNSKEDHNFVANVKNLIKGLNIFYIDSKDNLENIVQEFTNNINEQSRLPNMNFLIAKFKKFQTKEKALGN